MKKIVLFLMVLSGIAIVLSNCSQPKIKKGQATGSLVKPDGSKFSDDYFVFAIAEKDMKTKQIKCDLKYHTTKTGEFTLENLKPGRYALFILEQPINNNVGDAGNVPAYGQVSSKGKPVFFIMPDEKGVDIGIIIVTELLQ